MLDQNRAPEPSAVPAVVAVAGQIGRPTNAGIYLRRLTTMEEYADCERLQACVWGAEDVVRVTPLVLTTADHNGGLVIGAFVPEVGLIGFVFSFPGLTANGGCKQCSVLMAVDPAFQSSGTGYRLKLAQRDAALAQGLDLITWTFDPLISRNAYLNLAKLGCISSEYIENCYGMPERGLNAGLATDRLAVEWWIRSPRVERRLRGDGAPVRGTLINQVVPHPRSGLPANGSYDLDLSEPVLRIEIPGDIGAIKQADMELARAWRYDLRHLFRTYFSRGYRVTGFERAGASHPGYVLQREVEA